MKKQVLAILLIAMSFDFALAARTSQSFKGFLAPKVNQRDPALDPYATHASAAANCPLKSAKARTANTSGAPRARRAHSSGWRVIN
ncbi:MAG: hypothetical protein AB7H97_11425 [Pseudobdellovibrionaceae bacterium]